jgi:3-oxoacyl-[acyl-carrier-protein] synthase-3
MRASVLCGLGSWTPPDIVTNDQLAGVLDTSDEWIRKRTGVVCRHVAAEGMATSELAAEAGQRALKSAGLATVDATIVATTTPDRPCPATAPEVAARLGLGSIAAFDIAAVCTGFIYALANGAGFIAAGIADRVLVTGAEVFTSVLNPRTARREPSSAMARARWSSAPEIPTRSVRSGHSRLAVTVAALI